MRLLLLYLALWYMALQPAHAQPQHQYISKQFTVENGLPSNGIKGLQWDETTGFLWIATEAGIVRYDGINFQTFTQQNTPFITSERMSFITRSYDGTIYIADLPKNIISVQKNELVLRHRAPVNKGVDGSYLISVSERFYTERGRFQNPLLYSALYSNILALSDTSCLVKSKSRLLYLGLNLQRPVLLRDDVRQAFRVDSAVYVTDTLGHLYSFDTATLAFRPIGFDAATIGADPAIFKGNLQWENGMASPLIFQGPHVWLLKHEGNTLRAQLLMDDFPEDAFIRSAQYSPSYNILFVGSDSKGVRIYYPRRVSPKKAAERKSTSRNSYYAQIDLRNGNVLTNEGDIVGDSKTPAVLPLRGKFDFYTYLMGDSVLWYSQPSPPSNTSHLLSYNYNTGKTNDYPKIIGATAMVQSGHRLYIITNKGISVLQGDSARSLYPFTKPDNIIFQAIELEPAKLAIATCEGLFRYDIQANRMDTLFAENNTCIRSLWKYGEYLFFGSYGSGYFIMKQQQVRRMPLDKNKYLRYTHCFAPDNEGFVFMSTNRGLFKANLQQMLRAFEDSNANVYYYYLGQNDGMETTELNGGCTPCALQLHNNIISFPTMDGLLWVDPRATHPNLSRGEIFLDEVVADGTAVTMNTDGRYVLPAGTSDIRIRIAVPSWVNQENIYIDYQLNESGKWIPVETGRGLEIMLSNLPPDDYTIVIRKLNGFEVGNYTYRKLRFTIRAPWYLTWWATLLFGLAAIGFILLAIRMRTTQYRVREAKLQQQVSEKTRELQQQNEQLEKNNTIKTRLISIMSHDIVTPLKFVTAAGMKLLEKRKDMPEPLQDEMILEMANTAQEIQLLSTNILNWIKYQNENRRMARETFHVHGLVNQVLSILQTLARQKQLQLLNEVDPQLEVTEYFEPLKILVYNLLTNAIHFSSNGTIHIYNHTANGQVVISVKDSGSGMTAEQVQNILADRFIISSANIDNKKGHGLGYLIIKDLIKMMQASIRIDSIPGKGTTVHIVLAANDPAQATHIV